MNRKLIQKLLEQLWFQSDNCSSPIANAWFLINETSKITGAKEQTVREHFDKLIERKIIEKISDEPLLFQFTDTGRKVKSGNDSEKYVP
jgi:hypothetical protein